MGRHCQTKDHNSPDQMETKISLANMRFANMRFRAASSTKKDYKNANNRTSKSIIKGLMMIIRHATD